MISQKDDLSLVVEAQEQREGHVELEKLTQLEQKLVAEGNAITKSIEDTILSNLETSMLDGCLLLPMGSFSFDNDNNPEELQELEEEIDSRLDIGDLFDTYPLSSVVAVLLRIAKKQAWDVVTPSSMSHTHLRGYFNA